MQFSFIFFFSGIFGFESDLERAKEKHRGKHERLQINLSRVQCFYPKPVVFQDSILPFGFLKKKKLIAKANDINSIIYQVFILHRFISPKVLNMPVSKVQKQTVIALVEETIVYRNNSVYHHCFLKGDALLTSILGPLGLFQHLLRGERWN